jgi:hypothetical protein
MKTFTFTDQEASELASFYKHKLEEAKSRLESIQSLINKLDSQVTSSTETVEEIPTVVTSVVEDVKETIESSNFATVAEEEVVADSEEIDIDVANFNWNGFILETLKRNDSVFTMSELVDLGIKCYNLNKDEKGKISKKITPFFTQLLKNEEIKKFNIEGQTGYYYGLGDWFLKNGRVKKPYLIRFQEDKKKIKKEDRFHDNELQNFVASLLFEERRLITMDEFIERASNEFGLPESDKVIFIHNFKEEIAKMISAKNLVEYSVPSSSDLHYALPSWFKTNSELRKPFVTWE